MLGKNNKKHYFVSLTIILVTIGAITSIITPLMIQYYNAKNIQLSYQIILIVLGSMTISFLLQIIMMIFRENFAAKFNVNYLFELLEKLTKISYNTFVEKESTYLINRIMVAVDTLYLFIVSSFPVVIEAIFVIILSLIIILFISWKISLVLLCLLPLNFFGYQLINKRLADKMEKMQQQSASANKDLIVAFSNIDYVKAQTNSNQMNLLLKPNITKMYRTLANTNKYAQVSSSSISFINQVIQNSTYLWTSLMIINNTMPVENLIIISILIPMYYNALSSLSKVNIDYKSLMTSKNFIQTELEEQTEDNGRQILSSIETIDFNHPQFKLKNKVLKYNIVESIKKNDIVYLEGDSGSGKTSLLRLLLKFRTASGIQINKVALTNFNNESLRNRIAYLSQNPLILSNTLEKNIGMGKPLSYAQKKFIEESNILSSILKNKNWDSVLFENGGNLSGGEKQRIAICRMIIQQADLYILDESLSNIDTESAHAIMTFLTQHASNKLIIFTSHDKQFATYATKQIHIT